MKKLIAILFICSTYVTALGANTINVSTAANVGLGQTFFDPATDLRIVGHNSIGDFNSSLGTLDQVNMEVNFDYSGSLMGSLGGPAQGPRGLLATTLLSIDLFICKTDADGLPYTSCADNSYLDELDVVGLPQMSVDIYETGNSQGEIGQASGSYALQLDITSLVNITDFIDDPNLTVGISLGDPGQPGSLGSELLGQLPGGSYFEVFSIQATGDVSFDYHYSPHTSVPEPVSLALLGSSLLLLASRRKIASS